MSPRCARVFGPVRFILLLSFSTLLWLPLFGAWSISPAGAASPAGNHTAPANHHRSPSTNSEELTLVQQESTISSSAPFTFEVRTTPSAGSPSRLGLEVSLYSCLETRTELEQTVTSGPRASNHLGSTGLVPLRTLAVPGTAARYRMTVGLDVGGTPTPPPFDGSLIDLSRCTSGSYGGVYPVTVSLENRATHRVLAHFTTFFAYTQGPATRLRVALVLPVNAPVRAGGVAPLAASQVTRLSELVSSLNRPTPVTIAAVPQTLQDLAISGKTGSGAVFALRFLATQASTHEVLTQPYVPIRADSLAASGLVTEVTRQVDRGSQVLSALLGNTTTSGTWVAQRPVGEGAGAAVGAMGAHQVVLPASSLAPTSNKYTLSNTFSLDLGRGQQVPAAAADPELTHQFTANPRDPVLAAHQLLADLDLTYWEQPSVPHRGVIALPPAGWQADPAFVTALLQGLAPTANPDLEAVTLSQFFAQVTRASSSSQTPAVRQLSSSGADATLPSRFVGDVRASRGQWNAFKSATQGAGGVLARLDDELLVSESSALGPSGRTRALTGFHQGLGQQLSQIQLATDRSITLTSRTAALPVTILSSAPYRVVAVLSLSSDKLQFPDGSMRQVALDRSTTPVRVQVVARTSGDLPVVVDLRSPAGDLILVHGRLTVRSTATSLVGVILTLVALAVLLGWWARSSWTRRRARSAHREPE